MAELDGLLNMIPIGDIAKKLGIDENVAKAAVSAAVPVIVAGMAANAQDKGGAKSLAGAATRHAKRGKQFSRVDDINTDEGEKIASNVFGANKPAVEKEVAKAGGIDPDLIAKIIPIVAPIIIAFIGNMLLKKQQESTRRPRPKRLRKKRRRAVASGICLVGCSVAAVRRRARRLPVVASVTCSAGCSVALPVVRARVLRLAAAAN